MTALPLWLVVGCVAIAVALSAWVHRRVGRKQAAALEGALQGAKNESAALRDQLETLSSVIDGMAEGVWITDREGTVVRHNPALAELLAQGGSLVGLRPLDVLRRNELHLAVMDACAGIGPSELETPLDGGRLGVVRVAPLGKPPTGSVAVFRDVTELRRLEKVRQDFVANVSHELRTPITAILGYAETLRSGGLEDTRHAPTMVEIIHRQSQRLSQLVSDLLDLSKLEGRTLRLEQSAVPLGLVASRAADSIRPSADQKQISVSLDLPDGLTALGDAQAIEQVLTNLLENAIKYTPPGGRVEVKGTVEGDLCSLAVRDTGVGMEAKHLSRVFERFYRVDRGRSRDRGGTGLGLSIVKHLVSAMQGDVQVASEPGAGSTFTVQLPSVRATPSRQAE